MYACMVFDSKYRCVSISYTVYVNNCFEMLMNFFFFTKKLTFLKKMSIYRKLGKFLLIVLKFLFGNRSSDKSYELINLAKNIWFVAQAVLTISPFMTNCQDVFLSKSHSYEEINIEHKNSYIYITLNPYFISLSQVWFNIVR